MKPVITVEGISKRYMLGAIDRHTFRDEMLYRWHRLRGRNPAEFLGKVNRPDQQGRGEFWALKDVSFSVDQGEVVGLIGGNGAGKSTMLKILTRITEPTSGRAMIRGRVGSLLEVGTGFHPELTGRENIYMNGAILGMKTREIDTKFDEIADFSGVEKFIDTPVKRYSSGMYVRLAFAVAAHLEPEVLLIDEVLAVGDAAFQKKCLGKMGEIARGGRTILFVSHNTKAVRDLCTRCVWFENGQIRKMGDTDGIVSEYLGPNRVLGPVFPVASHKYNIAVTGVRTREDGHDLIVSVDVESSRVFQEIGLTLIVKDASGNIILKSADYHSGAIATGFSGHKTLSVLLENLAGMLNPGEYQIDVVIAIPKTLLLLHIPGAASYSPAKRMSQQGEVVSASKYGPLRVISRGVEE